MTDTTNELAPPTPDSTDDRIEDLCRQHQVLRQEASKAREEYAQMRSTLNDVRLNLERGLKALDENDSELAEQVAEFLEANTPWEFSLTREYRVEIRGWVTVEARNESDAIRMVEEDGEWSWRNSRADIEPDSYEVHQAEEV